ncbi:aspartyl protease family protein [Mucilaginibacter sp. X5P1]|uniref:aspartyl protease family protein n=1 Tax=Mucilaginibacter sp. X5P1 TaxID=2723088 RepID=UPI001615BF5C|nr:aspartyl protease family protein [Mucilaginibacter sp. X5P1]MBB6139514.1 hypothetical protein [Mucilaginibacter sp. X5P1]
MKYILALLLALISFRGSSQNKLPVINASSSKAKIYEQDNPVSNWNISPKIKLDIFTTGKLIKSKTVKFKTDIDSVSFRIGPGQQKDFIVLLNGKDSCLTRIQSPEVKNYSKLPVEIHDTIPFFVNRFNTNFLPVVFNNADTLILNFDTGATDISFTNDALKQKVKSHPELYNTLYGIKIGHQNYKTKIYDIQLAGNETDGLLGWDLFDGMIVELDYDHNQLIVHSKMPKQILHDSKYSKFKIRYIKNRPFIESEISQSGIKSKGWFLFDLGYQRTIMLDNDLLREARFPTEKMEVIKKVIMHGTRGNEIPVITANLETLKLGNFELKDVPAQIIEQNKPMRGVNIHFLGNDVLKRFNTVLDFQKNEIYLKPNHLYGTGYADQKKSGA